MNSTQENSVPASTAFVIALTGGIASGKSTVAGLFADLGIEIIDTGAIARDLVEPGQPLLSSVVAAFGQELLDAYGRLERRKLRDLIFSNKEKRQQLEAMMHPEIAQEARRQIRAIKNGYCMLVIPLLAEKGGFSGVDRVLVVDADTEDQLHRLGSRDDVSPDQAQAALDAQATREQRLSYADDVINNSGSVKDLAAKVQEMHQFYLFLSNPASGENPE